jgi:hypothetical protein
MDAPTIDTLGVPVTLVKPRPSAILAFAATDRDDPESYCFRQCAALGLCWPAVGAWPAPKRPTWSPGRPIVDYGAAVFDALLEAGRTLPAVLAAAKLAYEWALSTLPKEQEIKAAADFSGAPAGG